MFTTFSLRDRTFSMEDHQNTKASHKALCQKGEKMAPYIYISLQLTETLYFFD
jgi:hypothetical protein